MYSNYYLQERKTGPNVRLFVVPALIAVAIGVIYFATTRLQTYSKASAIVASQSLHLDLKDQSVAVFVRTETATTAYLVYGDSESQLTSRALDIRGEGSRNNFIFALSALNPKSKYFYRVIAADGLILGVGEGGLGQFVTEDSNFESVPASTPVYGKVVDASGNGVENAVVIVHQADQQDEGRMSYALTKATGEFLSNLTWQIDTKTTLNFEIFGPSSSSRVLANILHSSPLPQNITLGRDYDFTTLSSVLGTTDDARPAKTSILTASSYVLSVDNPKQGAQIASKSPLIKGRGIPNTKVSVSINSSPTTVASVTVPESGLWVVETGRSFLPGTYTATISLRDVEGGEQKIGRQFTIAKSGEQVLAASSVKVSTPSATLVPANPTITPIKQISSAPLPTTNQITTYPINPNPPAKTTLPQAGFADLNILVYIGAITAGLGLLLINTNKVEE